MTPRCRLFATRRRRWLAEAMLEHNRSATDVTAPSQAAAGYHPDPHAVWLLGHSEHEWSPNENYGRSDELARSRCRATPSVSAEQARSRTDSRTTEAGVGGNHFRFEKARHDAGRTHLRQTGLSTGRTGQLCLRHRSPLLLSTALGTSSRRRPVSTRRAPRALQQGLRILRAARRSSHPRSSRPAHGQAAAVYTADAAAPDAASTRTRGLALERSVQRIFMPPNVSVWTRACSHRNLPRPLGGRELRHPPSRSPDKQSLRCRPSAGPSTARSPLGQPDDPPGHADALVASLRAMSAPTRIGSRRLRFLSRTASAS